MTTFTYTFITHDSDIDSPVNAKYDVPVSGYANESDAYAGFIALPFFQDIGGQEYWNGSLIGQTISCKES